MHPSQAGPFRKTIIVLLTLMFTGALLVFTSMANLDLLQHVYPDPKFYMFGLLALEGGVIYWTGYYLLQLSGVHKGIAIIALAVDAIVSGVGFFYEMENVTHAQGTVQLPPIIVIIGFIVVWNVGLSIISHLIPTHSKMAYVASPKQDEWAMGYTGEQRILQQTENAESIGQGEEKPNFLLNGAATLVAASQDVMTMAQEKRKAGRPKKTEERQDESLQTSNTPLIQPTS